MRKFCKSFWEIYSRNIDHINSGFRFNMVAAMAAFVVLTFAIIRIFIPGDGEMLLVMLSASGVIALAVILWIFVVVVFISAMEAIFGPTDEDQGRKPDRVRPVTRLDAHRRRKAGRG